MAKSKKGNSLFGFFGLLIMALGLSIGIVLTAGKASLSPFTQAALRLDYTNTCNEEGFFYGCNYPTTVSQCYLAATKHYRNKGYTEIKPNCCVKGSANRSCYVYANPGVFCTHTCRTKRECGGIGGIEIAGVCKEGSTMVCCNF